MFKEYFILLLSGHILGDFYIQTSKIAEKKKNKMKWVLFHGLLYFLTVTVTGIPERLVCNWILGLLIVHKPANILIQNLIGSYMKQYSAIGLVLTAKSIVISCAVLLFKV